MAEAMVVEERPAVPKRFFCHMCNVEINIPNADYTCPLCANGFVEELPARELTTSASTSGSGSSLSGSGSTNGSSSSTSTNSSGSSVGGIGAHLNVESLRNDIVSLLNMRNVPNLEITIEPNRRHSNVVHLPLGPSGSSASASGGGSVGGGSAGGARRPHHLDRLDNVLFDFLQSLPLSGATAEIVTGPGAGTGNSHMFFMGNPGDYAWGREGLDTIVTQMLNQMETSGPPPLSVQRINDIPNVKVTAEEVERKMQCSICWDDFKLDETVRKLPCSHLYHENCIVPWLNLHSTCPICRKSLAEDDPNEDYVEMEDLSGENGGDTLHGTSSSNSMVTATATAPRHTSSSSQTAAQTVTQQQQQQQQQRNNVFTFDDDNIFLD
ncbi:E3 ubiquitin-protein ligase Iruka [Scaptodrosophila lebanonensis]|uniref:RING-type E3 ubiquitin transferase n=1 Tax=Drosophila lebanonensis TaxID=7225 RepID=A0A6J2TCP4_DROLE|nr:E3 ubiquitin-protein ligase Iruka [Scaptodrosophila lebanonensis]